MGIGGSIIDPAFIEEYLGMRVESVDEVEIIRRMTEEIYDKAEFEKALAWTKEKCKEGFDKNPEAVQKTPEEKEKDWEFVVKMMIIIKDLMNGNQNLPEGREEEMVGHNAIAAGFQGQRQWTDFPTAISRRRCLTHPLTGTVHVSLMCWQQKTMYSTDLA